MPLDNLLKSPQAKTAMTGFLGGAAGGAVMSALTGKKSAKKLLKAGGLVALGGVAWSAYQQYKDGTPAGVEPGSEQVVLQAPSQNALEHVAEETPLPLFQAMVAAANADGHLTESEQTRIWQKAMDVGVDGTALNALDSLLKNPPSMSEVVASANTMDEKLELYTASLLAIDDGCAAGRAYLDQLGPALGLPKPLISAVESAGLEISA